MVQPKFCKGLKPTVEEGVPVQREMQEIWNLGSFWNTYKITFDFMVYKIFHPIFTVWLFYRLILLVIFENPGPAFVKVSKHFNSFQWSLEPGVNYILWISVMALILSFMCHFVTCFTVLSKDKSSNLVSEVLSSKFLSIQMQFNFLSVFICGLALLPLTKFHKSPQVESLLFLHLCSGLLVLGLYLDNLKTAKQSPTINKSSNGTTTDVLEPNTLGVFVNEKNQERISWLCSSTYKIVHLVFTVWLNLCVILLILNTNLGPAFVDASKRFGLTDTGYNLEMCEPIINLTLWILVVVLHFDACSHANICFDLFVGSNTHIKISDGPIENEFLVSLKISFALAFASGLMLLRLYEFYLSPQILCLMILHACSGLMVLSYYKIHKTTKQTSVPKGGSDDIPTIIISFVA